MSNFTRILTNDRNFQTATGLLVRGVVAIIS